MLFFLGLCSAHRQKIMQRARQLIWRTRYLLLVLCAVFLWSVPGEPLWQGFLAPSQAGVFAALDHLVRLLLSLVSVAIFLSAMPLSALLSGLYVLLKPLRRVGFDAQVAVIRLLLVLRYIETLPSPRDWRSLLDPSGCVPESLTRELESPFVELELLPFSRLDWAFVCLVASVFLLLGYFCR